MESEPALLLAMSTSFVVFALAGIWHWRTWLAARPLASAATALLWVHALRHVALQVFSSQAAGFGISDRLAEQIAWGDYAGMVLAIAAIAAWRHVPRLAVPLTWVFVVATAVDLVNAAIGGIREDLFGSATDVTWMILAFYVPLLWVTLVLLAWQVATRASEAARPRPGGSRRTGPGSAAARRRGRRGPVRRARATPR